MTFSPDKSRLLRALRVGAAGLLAFGLLIPAAAIHAAPASKTGTLIGNLICGSSEETPASNILVVAEGMNLQTHTDDAGRFRLVGVPAGPSLTIDAVAEATASRFNVVVEPGEILDIGSIDVLEFARPWASLMPMRGSLPTFARHRPPSEARGAHGA